MIIAIDGPAASGKSTVAKALAEKLGLRYLDSGAMYRAVAFRALAEGISLNDEHAVAALARREPVTFAHEGDSPLPTRVFIGGTDVTGEIRTPVVDDAVGPVAKLPDVRAALVEQQRVLARERDIVIEGRDIGTVVFPNAEVKVFLTADPSERARRRHAERELLGEATDEQLVREAMARRDTTDSTRAAAPLKPADDAVHVDSTGMNVDEVVDAIAALVPDVAT